MGGKRYSTEQIIVKLRQAKVEIGRVNETEYRRRSLLEGPRSEKVSPIRGSLYSLFSKLS